MVEHLLANGANLVRLNGWNEGAIDLAASAGYWELVALLRNRSLQGKVCVCVCVCVHVCVCVSVWTYRRARGRARGRTR